MVSLGGGGGGRRPRAEASVSRHPGRSYRTEAEEAERRQVWLSNRKLVLVHNILADQGIKSYRLGMTEFADLVCPRGRRLCASH